MVTVSFWSLKGNSNHGRTLQVQLHTSVDVAIAQIANIVFLDPRCVGIFFLGRRLANQSNFDDCVDLREHHTVYAFQCMKIDEPPISREKPNSVYIDRIRAILRSTFGDRRQFSLLIKMTSDRDTITSLIGSTPGLKEDRLAQSILSDPLLLLHWLEDDDIETRTIAHPAILEACEQLLSTLHSEAVKSTMGRNEPDLESTGNSDDDEEPNGGRNGPVEPQRQQMHLTRTNLTAALAAALDGRNTAPFPTQPPITPEVFQQAMRTTLLGTATATQPPLSSMVNFDVHLEQLASIGFTDRNETMNALTATNGNLEAALEFIINERERLDVD